MDSLVLDYANGFKELSKKKQRDYVVRTYMDSMNPSFLAYRIEMTLNLLAEEEIPNRIMIHDNFKIVFFTDDKMTNDEISKMKTNLKQKGFYKKPNQNLFRSRYSEWILLINKKNDKRVVIKNMSYETLDKIIEKYGNGLR